MSVRVKICGITRLEDALAAADFGADAVGFVFHRPSPRYIEPERAAEIVHRLPSFVTAVGVFVDCPAEEVRRIAGDCHLDRAQLSGDERPDYCRDLGVRWIKAFRLREPSDLDRIAAYGDGLDVLLDAYVEGVPGGTGERFDWELARKVPAGSRVILAGGLNPDNVGTAVLEVRPFAVDVSSGVESESGIKDHRAVERFIAAAKSVDVD